MGILNKQKFTGNILGIDPSLRNTGLSIISFVNSIPQDLILIKQIKISLDSSFMACIYKIYMNIMSLMTLYKIDHIAIEKTIFVQNIKTAKNLGAIRAIIIEALLDSNINIPIYEYSPLKIKKSIVGSGRASKIQVIKSIKNIFNLKRFLSNDEADAIGIALCHSFSFNAFGLRGI